MRRGIYNFNFLIKVVPQSRKIFTSDLHWCVCLQIFSIFFLWHFGVTVKKTSYLHWNIIAPANVYLCSTCKLAQLQRCLNCAFLILLKFFTTFFIHLCFYRILLVLFVYVGRLYVVSCFFASFEYIIFILYFPHWLWKFLNRSFKQLSKS